MDKNIEWYVSKKIARTLEGLKNNNMTGYYVENREQLLKTLRNLISENSVVGIGDSMTLFETGVIDFLRNGKYMFLDKYRNDITSKEKKQIYIQNFSADTFICSTNALTENGELYNIDGNGSRVAPMIYGPKQVLLVASINKIVKDIDEAKNRVRNYAAPIDAKRLNKNTPCTKLGYCVDCKSPNRICNYFTIIARQFIKDRIKVIIVGENLGY